MKAELFNFKCWINECDSDRLKNTLQQLLEESGFTILGFMDHHFTPQGYTCIWLLSESHLAIHTYPEHSTSYIELTSCEQSKKEVFENKINAIFERSKEPHTT